MLLQSNDDFDELIELNTLTNQIVYFSKRRDKLAYEKIQGRYSIINNHFLGFYRDKNLLHFRLDDQDFILEENIKFSFTFSGSDRLIHISSENETLSSYSYSLKDAIIPLEQDITPFIEAEDFDFGLFVFNVIQNAHRRGEIFQ